MLLINNTSDKQGISIEVQYKLRVYYNVHSTPEKREETKIKFPSIVY